MKRFMNILVGVDLSNGVRLVSNDLVAPTREAISTAIRLAKSNNSKLLFYYVLPGRATNLDAETQMLLEEHHGHRTVEDHANEVINSIAENARNQGVDAQGNVGCGTTWIELIRKVQLGNYDLVIAGTRHRGAVMSTLLGSTGIKLLRKCPCPVWIAQPGREIAKILVAHDLTPVGDLALELGASMANMHHAQLDVLHSVNYPAETYWHLGKIPEKTVQTCHLDAEQAIKAQLDKLALERPAKIHISSIEPSSAIVDFLNHHDVDLLAMGTVARTGIAGLIMGNTAEAMLSKISCSILAVKPEGFQTPVTAE